MPVTEIILNFLWTLFEPLQTLIDKIVLLVGDPNFSSTQGTFFSNLGGNVWVPLISAIIGGAISLLGSIVATKQAQKYDRLAQAAIEERRGAEMAFSTFYKLLHAYNSACNLSMQFNEFFEMADRNGSADLEPWAKVAPIIGAQHAIEKIAPNETSFLISINKADLLNDVHLIQMRIANILASAEKYNELRMELHSFLEANASESQLDQGTLISGKFSDDIRDRASLREAQLNNLIGQILVNLDSDIPESWRILEEFNVAAKERYGSVFPDFKADKTDLEK